MPRIEVAGTAGFCFGVKRAIGIASETAGRYGRAYTLGPLIHNDDVIRELEGKGVFVTEEIDAAHSPIIIRSHGVPRKVYDELAEKKLTVVDATCPFVEKIHRIVSEESARGADILIIGDRNHPEVIGILGFADRGMAVNNEEELRILLKTHKSFGKNALVCVAQTTFDLCKWEEIKKIVRKHYTNVKFFDTICKATV